MPTRISAAWLREGFSGGIIDLFHKWRLLHENEARMTKKVSQYLFPTTKMTCFYVLSLLKSLNNSIIQILNLTLKLTLKTNPNA